MAGLGVNQYMAIGNASFQGTQAGLQLYNAYRLNKQLKGMDDTYNIPPEIGQNLNQANTAALQGLPQAQKDQYLNNLNTSSAYSLSSLGDLNSGLKGVAGANNQLNQGYGNLLAQDSAARMQNQNALYGVRNEMADYKNQQWVHNVDQPYWRTSDKKDAYFTAAGRQASQTSSNLAGSSAFGGSGKANDSTGDYSNPNSYGTGANNGYGKYYNPNQQGGQSGSIYDESGNVGGYTGNIG